MQSVHMRLADVFNREYQSSAEPPHQLQAVCVATAWALYPEQHREDERRAFINDANIAGLFEGRRYDIAIKAVSGDEPSAADRFAEDHGPAIAHRDGQEGY